MPSGHKPGDKLGTRKKGRPTKKGQKHSTDDVIVLDEPDSLKHSAPPRSASMPSKRSLRASSKSTVVDYYDGRSSSKQGSFARRMSRTDVELMMECVDDDLSPAQLAAIQLAKEEHERANNLIKAARAGNVLVPSSQPNTFTVVPPTAKQVQASGKGQAQAPGQGQGPKVAPKVMPKVVQIATPKASPAAPTPTPPSQGLPQPRSAQFMNKQKTAKPQTSSASTSASPDVIVIDETPPPAVTLTPMSPPVQQKAGNIISPAGATPQQVYKFVSLAGNQPAKLAANQWVIRPLLTVPPQQQPALGQATMAVPTPTPVQLVNPKFMAGSPRPPGLQFVSAESSKGDGQVLSDGQVLRDGRVSSSHSVCSPPTIRTQSTSRKHETGLKVCAQGVCVLRQRTICSKALFYKKELSIVNMAELYRIDKGLCMDRVTQDNIGTLRKYSKHRRRKMRRKTVKLSGLHSENSQTACVINGAAVTDGAEDNCDTTENITIERLIETSALMPFKGCQRSERDCIDDNSHEGVNEHICDSMPKQIQVKQKNTEDLCVTKSNVIDIESDFEGKNDFEEATELRGLDMLEDLLDDCFSAGCLSEEFRDLPWSVMTEKSKVDLINLVKDVSEPNSPSDNSDCDSGAAINRFLCDSQAALSRFLSHPKGCSGTNYGKCAGVRSDFPEIHRKLQAKDSDNGTKKDYSEGPGCDGIDGTRELKLGGNGQSLIQKPCYVKFPWEVREILSGESCLSGFNNFQFLVVFPLTAASRNVMPWPLFTDEATGQNPITFQKSFELETDPEDPCNSSRDLCSDSSSEATEKPECFNSSFLGLDLRTASGPELETVQPELKSVQHELKSVQPELESVQYELQTVQQELETVQRELETVQRELETAQPELQAMPEELQEDQDKSIMNLVNDQISEDILESDEHNSNQNCDGNIASIYSPESDGTIADVQMPKFIKPEAERGQKLWYQSLSWNDRSTIAELSTSYGVTKLSKLLHIPKTELMTWKRSCRLKLPEVNKEVRDTLDVFEIKDKGQDKTKDLKEVGRTKIKLPYQLRDSNPTLYMLISEFVEKTASESGQNIDGKSSIVSENDAVGLQKSSRFEEEEEVCDLKDTLRRESLKRLEHLSCSLCTYSKGLTHEDSNREEKDDRFLNDSHAIVTSVPSEVGMTNVMLTREQNCFNDDDKEQILAEDLDKLEQLTSNQLEEHTSECASDEENDRLVIDLQSESTNFISASNTNTGSRRQMEEMRDTIVRDHAYAHSESKLLEQVTIDSDEDANYEREETTTLSYPQDEWEAFEGKEIRVFRGYTERERKKLSLFCLKFGTNTISDMIQIPEDYLKGIINEKPESAKIEQCKDMINEKPKPAKIEKGKSEWVVKGKGFIPLSDLFHLRKASKRKSKPSKKPKGKSQTSKTLKRKSEPSEQFKQSVLKVARESGFEKTARWYNISVADIMKWQDSFGIEKLDEQLNELYQRATGSSEGTRVDDTSENNRMATCEDNRTMDASEDNRAMDASESNSVIDASEDNRVSDASEIIPVSRDKQQFTEALRTKLAHIAKQYGQKEVANGFNLKVETIRRWCAKYKFKTLPDYELTLGDYQQIILHAEKKNAAKKTRTRAAGGPKYKSIKRNAKETKQGPSKQAASTSEFSGPSESQLDRHQDIEDGSAFGQSHTRNEGRKTENDADSEYPLLLPSEIKEEPMDEELELLHQYYMQSSRKPDPQDGDDFLDNGGVDTSRSYLGPQPFYLNNTGLGDGITNSQPNSSITGGSGTHSAASSQYNNSSHMFTSVFHSNQGLQDSFGSEHDSLTDNIKTGSHLHEGTGLNSVPSSDTKDKLREKIQDKKGNLQRNEQRLDKEVSGSSESATAAARQKETKAFNLPPLQKFTPPATYTFSVSDEDLEQQRALRNTLLALKSRKMASEQTVSSESTVELNKQPPVQGKNPLATGRIESLIKGISNRVGTPYSSPGNITPVKEFLWNSPTKIYSSQNMSGSGHSQIAGIRKSPVSPRKSPLSPNKTFTAPVIIRGTFRKPSESTSTSRDTVSVDSPSKSTDSTSDQSCTSKSCETFDTSEDNANNKNRKRDGSVNLSEKLKSLLQADIFNIVDKDDENKDSETEEEDLIELLASAGKKDDKVDTGITMKRSSSGKNLKQQMGQNSGLTEDEQNLQRRFFYSLGLKQKLGKLAQRFSVLSVSKMYMVAPKTISKWKALYQNVDLPDLEFTKEENEELRIVRVIKESHKKLSPDKYQIYIDNPEPDADVSEIKEQLLENKVPVSVDYTVKETVARKRQPFMLNDDHEREKDVLDKRLPLSSGLNSSATQRQTSQSDKVIPSSPTNLPLYIDLSDTTSSAVRENLRKSVKSKDGQETQLKSGGVFTVSGDSVKDSSKQVRDFNISAGNGSALPSKFAPTAPDKSAVGMQDEYFLPEVHPANRAASTQRPVSSSFERNSTTPENTQSQQSRNETVYLCPIEGIFKYRIPDKETPIEKVNSAESESSKEFKQTVVEEARKSGFEITAKRYNIPMTDIMKWHDGFVKENSDKQSRVAIVKHALNHGVIDASEKFSVSRAKVVEWLGMDVEEDNGHTVDSNSAPTVETLMPTRTQKRGISFDSFSAREGKILKPRFNIQEKRSSASQFSSVPPAGVQQKTRMGGQNIQTDIQSNIGTMPRFKKQSGTGVEIASTWKQVQDYLNPTKHNERKYSQDFKNRIIRECMEKGQKVVSKEHRIPYNEISRWRLEAKKNSLGKKPERPMFSAQIVTNNTSSETVIAKDHGVAMPSQAVAPKSKNLTEKDVQSTSVQGLNQLRPKENESLKIKIKLSKKPEIVETSQSGKASGNKHKKSLAERPNTDDSRISKAQPKPYVIDIKQVYKDKEKMHKEKEKEKVHQEKEKVRKEKEKVKEAVPTTVEDSETDFRLQVVNYCIKYGVLKTQKHFSVTRQSVIDLMTEYDELNRYAVTAINKNLDLKTKLVSREKTSVEDGTQNEPIIVSNLQDYIVTAEYKQNVVDYAVAHGITAATRKFKRKSSTVKSWISHFGKKDVLTQLHTGQPKTAASVMTDEKLKVVEYAKKYGITEASKRFKKKAVIIKNWMGHYGKMERTKKKLENNTDIAVDEAKQSPLKLIIPQPSHQAVSPSPVWDQDFVIKPNSSNSPLKLTLSPRRKSPVVHIASDDVNDIETEDEWDVVDTAEFEEVATWAIDADPVHPSVDKNDENSEKKENSSEEKTEVDISEEQDKSLNEHPEDKGKDKSGSSDDILISPSDVPNILEMDMFKTMFGKDTVSDTDKLQSACNAEMAQSTGETLAKDKLDGDGEPASFPGVVIIEGDEEVETDELNKEESEMDKTVQEIKNTEVDDESDDVENIPYEKTVMFQLHTDEVDKFFNDMDNLNVVAGDTADDNTRKTVNSKKTTPKRPRRYADVEIMANIEETCIFSPVRPARKTTETTNESKNTGSQNETLAIEPSQASDKFEEIVDSNSQVKLDGSYEEKQDQESTVEISDSKNVEDNDKTKIEEAENVDEQVTRVGKDRSLFDIIVSPTTGAKPDDNAPEEKKENGTDGLADADHKENGITDKKEGNVQDGDLKLKTNQNASRSLFDSLIKNIRLPLKGDIEKSKALNMTQNKLDSVTENIPDKNPDDKNSQDAKPKDRSERNVFDFMTPEPFNSSVKPTQEAGRDNSSSTSRQSDDSSSENSKRASDIVLKPKPMFKFPKLQLPVNFGSIAKLGIAKIKDEKSKEQKAEAVCEVLDAKVEIANSVEKQDTKEIENRDDAIHRSSTSVGMDSRKEAHTSDKGKTEYFKEGVVMETFEELRKRLAEERAKKREEGNIQMADKEAQETESKEDDKPLPNNSSDITDNEMYKDFTPQKIVLILDISKKHGIEFALTSFDLPAFVIVNWIIEKDRKHRKIGSTVTLENKLLAIRKLCENVDKVDEISNQFSVSNSTLLSWKDDVKWLLDSKNVTSVLDKWQKVQSVTSLDESGKASGKDNPEMQEVPGDVSETLDMKDENTEDKITVGASEAVADAATEPDNIDNNTENASEVEKKETESEQVEGSGLPGVLSFVLKILPRDFTVEQKAMIVLLMDKYGLKEVHRKLGINKGTLWTWKNQNKIVKQFLDEQKEGVRKKRLNKEESDAKNQGSPKGKHQAEVAIVVENQNEGKIETDGDEKMKLKPSGYRYISPTKLPNSLKGTRKIPTKEYSLEQRVAIVKLVELYGVRTVHKQFRIPCGSIWNWQHCKNVLSEMRKMEGKETSVSKAAKCLSFDGDQSGADPFTIDLIADRVLAAVDNTEHLKFKIHQKADVVCVVNHFGMDYVCEKLPSIPRGTLWNWCHNKNVLEIVESNMELLKKYRQLIGKRSGFGEEERVDKVMMTQRWLNSCQQSPVTGTKRKSLENAGSTSSSKKSRSTSAETGYLAESENDVEILSGSEIGGARRRTRANTKNSNANIDTQRDSSSDSSVSSISGHSNDFEEIVSDDDNTTPSIYSKRSGTSGKNSLTSKNSSNNKVQKGKSKSSPKVDKSVGQQSSAAVNKEVAEVEQEGPEYDVIRIEPGAHNRLMVLYEVINKGGKADAPAGSKRPLTETSPGPPAKKRSNKKDDLGETDSRGNWIPLDEYYYGTMEGDAGYEEEKGEYRFKCWYCSKMLYNNVRAMQHIQGHIDSSKQQNIDLSDLTQCKHCYKQFDTPFEMQTHVEKVHLSNKVLMCRICEKDFSAQKDLIHHMRQNHYASEMPYACQLCNFRSSMYSDVVDHFKKKHDSSNHLLCLYCLRTFHVKFVSQGWGQTQTYYGHLMKHQSKSSAKKCIVCRLTFFNALDVKTHRKNHHGSNNRGVQAGLSGANLAGQNPVMIKVPDSSVPKKKRGPHLKSLNAPSMSKIQDYGGVQLPEGTKTSFCFECKMTMSSVDHFKKHINCSLCRFATSCSVAYANHMMGFHSGQMSSLNLNIPWERPQAVMLYCACGFSTKYGNKIANHLVICAKQTCYSQKPEIAAAGTPGKKGDGRKSEGSLLGVLGLVQKKAVSPRVRTAQSAAQAKKDDEEDAKSPLAEKKRGKRTVSPAASKRKPGPKSSGKRYEKFEKSSEKAEKSSEKPDKVTGEFSQSKADTEVKDDKDKKESKYSIVTESSSIKADTDEMKSDVGREEVEKPKDLNEEMKGEEGNKREMEVKADDGESEIKKESDSSDKMPDDVIESKDDTDKKEKDDNQDSETKKESDEIDQLSVANNVMEAESKESTEKTDEENPADDKGKEDEQESVAVNEETEEPSWIERETSEDGEKNAGNQEAMETEVEEEKVNDIEDPDEKTDADGSAEAESEDDDYIDDIIETSDNTGNAKDDTKNAGSMAVEETKRTENKEAAMDTDSKHADEEKDDSKDVPEKDKEIPEDDEMDRSVDEKIDEPTEDVSEIEQDSHKDRTDDEAAQKETAIAGPSSGLDDKGEDNKKDEEPSQIDHSDQQERRDSDRRQNDHHSSRGGSQDRSRHDQDRHRHDDRSRDDRHHVDQSRDSHRSDSYHGNRSHDRGYERDRSHDRSYRGDDHRHGSDDRGHGYHRQRGQGYHGNQDRRQDYRDQNYNSNYGNCGGYNQNYRGGYRGGYY